MSFGHAPRLNNRDTPAAPASWTAAERDPLASKERRKHRRQHVLERAKLLLGTSSLDCLVLDRSPQGVNIRTGTVVCVPERVIIQFPDGTKLRATRRWTRGLEIGFSLDDERTEPTPKPGR